MILIFCEYLMKFYQNDENATKFEKNQKIKKSDKTELQKIIKKSLQVIQIIAKADIILHQSF